MLKVYTSQYRYSGPNRLDITTRSKEYKGLAFSPRWELVKAYKDTGDKEAYMTSFHTLILQSYTDNIQIWKDLLAQDIVVLVCFCKSGDFCHRLLVADYLVQSGAQYMGEIPANKDINPLFMEK